MCDRLILPKLDPRDLPRSSFDEILPDAATRDFLSEHLGFRFVAVTEGTEALTPNARVQRGALGCGRPVLNPISS